MDWDMPQGQPHLFFQGIFRLKGFEVKEMHLIQGNHLGKKVEWENPEMTATQYIFYAACCEKGCTPECKLMAAVVK